MVTHGDSAQAQPAGEFGQFAAGSPGRVRPGSGGTTSGAPVAAASDLVSRRGVAGRCYRPYHAEVGINRMRRYWPAALAAVVALSCPAIYGVYLAPEYALADPFDHFDLAMSNLLPLLFPLLPTLIYGPIFAAELSGGYWMPAQAREGRRAYVRRHVSRAATTAGLLYVTVVLAWGAFTMRIAPALNLINYQTQTAFPVPRDRFTWSQLVAFGEPAFFVGYGLWVGLHAALYGALSVLLLIHISNHFLALAAPALAVFLINFVLGNLDLGNWGLLPAVFTGNLMQGPLWIPLINTLPLIGLCTWLYIRARNPGERVVAFQ
ncbi:MAG: hypothetical protein Q4F67_14095 [Propionibacteriaceae bacterium]|nr:hypothetical protein [Propionibacteriaceae bacterium]